MWYVGVWPRAEAWLKTSFPGSGVCVCVCVCVCARVRRDPGSEGCGAAKFTEACCLPRMLDRPIQRIPSGSFPLQVAHMYGCECRTIKKAEH